MGCRTFYESQDGGQTNFGDGGRYFERAEGRKRKVFVD